MFKPMQIKAQSGSYALDYDTELLSRITDLNTDSSHFIADENVAESMPIKCLTLSRIRIQF